MNNFSIAFGSVVRRVYFPSTTQSVRAYAYYTVVIRVYRIVSGSLVQGGGGRTRRTGESIVRVSASHPDTSAGEGIGGLERKSSLYLSATTGVAGGEERRRSPPVSGLPMSRGRTEGCDDGTDRSENPSTPRRHRAMITTITNNDNNNNE